MYTSDDVLFAVYVVRNHVTEDVLEEAQLRFFSKDQPCFRASALPKRYGWGIHSNHEGKLALYAVESAEYQALASRPDVRHLKAMRSQRP